eukprot:COSAG06_NODE_87_length_24962_cov_107.553795_22_plen_67_part_00
MRRAVSCVLVRCAKGRGQLVESVPPNSPTSSRARTSSLRALRALNILIMAVIKMSPAAVTCAPQGR